MTLPACAASAQPAVDELKARQLLSSPLLSDQAWGVFRAHRLELPGLDRLLLDQLASLRPYAESAYDSPEGATIQAVFDALAQIQTFYEA